LIAVSASRNDQLLREVIMIWFLTILILANLLLPIAVMIFALVLSYRLLKFAIIRLWQYFSNRVMLENELKQILGDGYKVTYRNKRKIHFFKRGRSAKGAIS
jgi:hypothetical protein